jgi:16S rRNA (cytidine1402-2'-O)-methyltransferase
MNKYGKLTLGAVPIGDFKDASLNLIDYIINHKIILVENIHIFNNLCNDLKIKTNAKIINFDDNESLNDFTKYIDILKNGTDILVLSDEGTSGIIDPGSFLLTKCKINGIPVKVMTGPNSIIPSVVLASFGPQFYFYGPSVDDIKRKKDFKILKEYNFPTVFFFTQQYAYDFISDAILNFGSERNVCLCINLTQKNELIKFIKLDQVYKIIIGRPEYVNITLVIQGKTPTPIN